MKFLINSRLKKYNSKSSKIEEIDIINAKTILFSVFSRYGDGIISFCIIKELIKKFPNKKYILLVPRQQLPYAKEILLDCKNLTIKYVNKRNPINLINVIHFLKKSNIDLGLNPWSYGNDSEFLISYSKKFFFYKEFDNFTKTYNLYDRVRKYFHLEIVENKSLNDINLEKIKQVLIAPISTDITKNLTIEQLNYIIKLLNNKYKNIDITVAIPKSLVNINIDVKKFIFGKNIKNSNDYLKELKKSDLFIGVDSGPLHIAMALKIPSIGIFGPTSPNTIFNNGQNAMYLRDLKMKNSFCFKECHKPICINNNIISNIFVPKYLLEKENKLETDICLMDK